MAGRSTRQLHFTKPKLILAVLVFGASAVWLMRPHAPPAAPKVNAADLSEQTSLATKAPEHATRLLVDRLDKEIPIEQIGLTKAGSVASPASIGKAGWYNKSSAPGTPGPTLIVGHYGQGAAFLEFTQLKEGDVLRIVSDKDQEFRYRLKGKQEVSRDKVPMEKVLGYSRENRLEIITCSGRWLESEQTFANRLLLTAELIKEGE
jgi:sortase (surface protein transpeptidase)